MALKWPEVIAKPEFQSLSPEQKNSAQDEYFNEVVVPQVPKDQVDIAKSQFYKEFPKPSTDTRSVTQKAVGSAMKVAKPVIEYGGAAVGAALGTVGEPGLGTAAGGAMGYLAGRKISDVLEQYAGTQPKRSAEGEMKTTLKDVRDSLLQETVGPAVGKVGEVGKAVLGKVIPKEFEKRLYEGVAKWTVTMKPKAREEITNTVLQEKIPFNETGYKKVMENITDLNKKVDSVIEESNVPLPGRQPSPAAQVVPRSVSQGEIAGAEKITEGQLKSPGSNYFTSGQVEKPTTTVSSMTGTPTSGMTPTIKLDPKKYPDMDNIMSEAKKAIGQQAGKINKAVRTKQAEEYINRFYKDFDGQMDLKLAQELKKDANRQLDAYFTAFQKGEFKPQSQADVDALNGIRAGLQKEIERLAPEVKPMNERLGKFLDVQGPLMRAINRDTNRNPITLSEWLATGLGEGIAGIPGAAGGFIAKKVLGSASKISGYAIKLHEARSMPEVKKILSSGVGPATKANQLRSLGYESNMIAELLGLKNQ